MLENGMAKQTFSRRSADKWEDVIAMHSPMDALQPIPGEYYSVFVDGKFRREFRNNNNAAYFAQRLMAFDPRISRIEIRVHA